MSGFTRFFDRRIRQRRSEPVKRFSAQPKMGRLIDDLPEDYREWVIPFGHSGYLARYHIDGETIVILAVRHQKEAGF